MSDCYFSHVYNAFYIIAHITWVLYIEQGLSNKQCTVLLRRQMSPHKAGIIH